MDFIYFIKIGDAVKIGRTTNLLRRLKMAQLWSPTPVRLLGICTGDEGKIHRKFKEHRIRQSGPGNEWFHLDKQIKKFIKKYCEIKKAAIYNVLLQNLRAISKTDLWKTDDSIDEYIPMTVDNLLDNWLQKLSNSDELE